MSEMEILIDEHRKMILVSGKLSDFQLKNLNIWPFVVFEKDSIEEITIDYNFIRQNEENEQNAQNEEEKEEALSAGCITYIINFNDRLFYTPQQVIQRIAEIRKWVKHLFWEDTEVTFQITTADGERINE